ncbi:MAG: hypothetical protein ABEJ91_00550 [Candidatus Nanohaloarchaea archaeon]
MAMPESWKHWLTVLYVEKVLEGYSGQKKVSYNGFEDTVYLFQSQIAAGRHFWWDMILMNERLFEENNGNARDYVYMHEVGHRQGSRLGMIIGPLQWSLHPAFVALEFIFAISAGLTFIHGFAGYPIPVDVVRKGAVFSLAVFPTAVTASWLLETKTDLFVINHMGRESYRKATGELHQIYSGRSWVNRIFSHLSHPTPGIVLKIHEIIGNTPS